MAADSLRERCTEALDVAFTRFQSHLAQSGAWSNVPVQPLRNSNSPAPIANISVERKQNKSDRTLLRAQADVICAVDLQDAEAILQLPEQRAMWDDLVDSASLIQALDGQTALTKTNYKLGWPAQPRDAITIARTWSDDSSLIYLATSLPNKSPDDPPFLRPAPPYVRAHVDLFAIVLELRRDGTKRLSIYLQWNLRGAIFARPPAEMQNLLSSFSAYLDKGSNLPLLQDLAPSLDILGLNFNQNEEILTLDIAITESSSSDKQVGDMSSERPLAGQSDLHEVSVALSTAHGWIVTSNQSPAEIGCLVSLRREEGKRQQLIVSISGASSNEHLAKVKISFKRLAGGKIVGFNSEIIQAADQTTSRPSTAVASLLESGRAAHLPKEQDPSPTLPEKALPNAEPSTPSTAHRQAISTSIKRSYTYFASLLQEPEAKWRHVTETKGVAISQLNSIDPTVTIFRAVATFVGVGVWDLFATVTSPGARLVWERNVEQVKLLDDVNDLSALWYIKYKAVWPAWPRDSVQIRTTYKAPSSVHIFSFTVDDDRLFPKIPLVGPNTIRTATVIQGWALEALSPTTTQVTLIEQTNNKGWSNKSWTYNQMLSIVGGVGEFAIKHGAPPVVTRLTSASVSASAYSHEKGSLKLEYKASANHHLLFDNAGDASQKEAMHDENQPIECEIRCEMDTWASSLDIVTDPPPSKVSCLLRHKLSASGSGCWITIEHTPKQIAGPILLLVRKGAASRPKGSVFVNGARIRVDTEGMKEAEYKTLSSQRRLKASPMPLDQLNRPRPLNRASSPAPTAILGVSEGTSPKNDSPIIKSPTTPNPSMTNAMQSMPVNPPSTPMSSALNALAHLQSFYAQQGPELIPAAPDWASVSEKGGLTRKKLISAISEIAPVFRGDKIADGVTAEDIAAVLNVPSLRPAWDDNVASCKAEAAYGSGCRILSVHSKPSFFSVKSRTTALAQAQAYIKVPSSSASSSTTSIYLFAAASCTPQGLLPNAVLNAAQQILLEGWILETLDPYAYADCAIPSTRVSYFTCTDSSGASGLTGLFAQTPLKYVDAVVRLAKNLTIPRMQAPSPFLQIQGPLSNEDNTNCRWLLKRLSTATEPFYLTSDFQLDRRAHSCTLLIPPSGDEVKEKSHSRSSSTPLKKIASPILRSTSSIASLPKHSLQAIPASPRPDASPEKASSFLQSPQRPQQNARLASSPPLSRSGLASDHASNLRWAPDSLVCELIISYEVFQQGYEVNLTSAFITANEVVLDRAIQGSQVPIRLNVYELPSYWPSNKVTAAHKQRQHLLRFSLTPASDHNQFSSPRIQKDPALISISVAPLSSGVDMYSSPHAGSSASQVLYNGSPVQIIGEKECKTALQDHEMDDWSLHSATISRVMVSSSDPARDLMPPELSTPMALTSASMQAALKEAASSSLQSETSKAAKSLIGSEDAPPKPSLAIASEDANTANNKPVGPKVSSLSDFLASYSKPLAAAVRSDVDLERGTYSLRFLLIFGLICFLLGSFLRSLLSPADFLMEVNEADSSVVVLQALHPERKWRQARRLFEMRLPLLENDVTLALVRRKR